MGVGGGISWDHTQSPRKKRLLIPRALVPCVPQPHDYTTARPHDKKKKKGTLPDPLETIYLTSLFQAVNVFLYGGLEVRGLVCVNDVLLGQLVEH